jgi:hypothetical protein
MFSAEWLPGLLENEITSKVFATIIASALLAIFTWIRGLIKKVSFWESFKQICLGIKGFLIKIKNKTVQFFISDTINQIVIQKLSEERAFFNKKLSDEKSSMKDFSLFFPGIWRLTYVKTIDDKEVERGVELFEIRENNQYWILDKGTGSPNYVFNVFPIYNDEHTKCMGILKVRSGLGSFHSHEYIRTYNRDRMEGMSSEGYQIFYQLYKS